MKKIKIFKSGFTGLAMLKGNFSKTYARISQSFLEAILHKCRSPVQFIRLIMHCVSTISYSILVNSSLSRLFKPFCGLRQGDLLSPYLFVLCMEALSRNLQLTESQKKFAGIKIGRKLERSVICFLQMITTFSSNVTQMYVHVSSTFFGIM